MIPISSAGRLSRAVNIEDLRELARRRLPRIVFNYIDGGADGEWTLRENRRAFDAITFRPHQAVAVPACDLRTRVLGTELSMPLLLAPVGYLRVMHPDGEIAAARAAGRAGVGFILSTVSGHRLENVKAASSGQVWDTESASCVTEWSSFCAAISGRRSRSPRKFWLVHVG
jgi:L-lactate dehydrogenase (cytochrome)